jgi:hypothetical protein
MSFRSMRERSRPDAMVSFYTMSDGIRIRINEAETDHVPSTYAATYPIALISVVICFRSWFCRYPNTASSLSWLLFAQKASIAVLAAHARIRFELAACPKEPWC